MTKKQKSRHRPLTDTELLNEVSLCCLMIGWESTDDPKVSRHAQRTIYFRGPVRDAILAAVIAERERLKFDADVWAPDFLLSRNLPHKGMANESGAELFAESHPLKHPEWIDYDD